MIAARYIFAFALVVSGIGSVAAKEEKSPDWNAETLTGDWGGTRSSLYEKGVEFGFTHKSDVLSNLSGGIKRGTVWMGNTEARVKMNLEKLAGWDATSAYIQYHSQLGSKFNRDYVDSFVIVDNIESNNTAKFFQAWIQKGFVGDNLSVLFGLYAIDSEFYVNDTSSVFTQTPYGMANDLGQSGMNAPPIFPTGALALRLKYTTPGKNFYAQYALTDGVPGDPNNPRGTHIQLNKGDGTFSILELGLTPQLGESEEGEYFNKTAIGYWRYSTRFSDLDTLNPILHPSQGAYFLAERTLMNEKDHPDQGLAGFVRYGVASKDIHQSDWTGSLGLRYHGLIDGRDDDISAIGITVSHASDTYQRVNASLSSETSVEATYRMQVNPWFVLQPTVQYVLHPNMNPARQNVWIAGARVEINF
ncbi:MAG: carbohydrate porin [Gallionella sp.]|nr:carbohydrate porin [Gallionella sp.]